MLGGRTSPVMNAETFGTTEISAFAMTSMPKAEYHPLVGDSTNSVLKETRIYPDSCSEEPPTRAPKFWKPHCGM